MRLSYYKNYQLSEEIDYPHLPRTNVATLLVESRGSSICRCLPSYIRSISTGNIIVGTHLQVLESCHTKAEIHAEVTLLQRIATALCPFKILFADIESNLRPSKKEDICQTTQADRIAYVHWY